VTAYEHRDFICVKDLSGDAGLALNESAVNQTKNLVGTEAVTIKGIAEVVRRAVGDEAIECKDARPGECGGKIASTEEGERDLGGEPRTRLEKGLRRYTERHKSALEKA